MDSGRVSGSADADDIALRDIAVLVRLRALMGPVAEALERLGLPVERVGHGAFIDGPGGREVLAALRALPDKDQECPAAEAVARTTGAGKDADAWQTCRMLAERFGGTLRQFLDRLLLREGADRYDREAEAITLMTLHAAKGLEFPVVFVAGCEAGILPYVRPGEEPDVDEERRLLYVGMTRAQRALYLTRSRRRTLFGKTEKRAPSPFLAEIEARLRETLTTGARKRRPTGKQLELF